MPPTWLPYPLSFDSPWSFVLRSPHRKASLGAVWIKNDSRYHVVAASTFVRIAKLRVYCVGSSLEFLVIRDSKNRVILSVENRPREPEVKNLSHECRFSNDSLTLSTPQSAVAHSSCNQATSQVWSVLWQLYMKNDHLSHKMEIIAIFL